MIRSAASVAAALLVALTGCAGRAPSAAPLDGPPLRLVVTDPLADKLACACVAGYAQRKYDRLAEFLAPRLGAPVEVVHGESLVGVLRDHPGGTDIVVGKQSVVIHDAAELGLRLHPVARLTDRSGGTDLTGLFVVRWGDPARRIADLKGRRILLGPVWAGEKHAAALRALDAAGVARPEPLAIAPGCTTAAVAVVEREADAAVISSYAHPLLEGCGTVDKGALRIIGRTEPLPFVTVFVADAITPEVERRLRAALLDVRKDKRLCRALESRAGFVPIAPPAGGSAGAAPSRAAEPGWTDWRGPHRDGLCPGLPERLPAEPEFAWRRRLTGLALAGVAATEKLVIVADKSADGRRDVWRGLRASDGRPIWKLEYDARGELDYGNGPRAAPVLAGGRAILLGAFGHLHCVELEKGRVIWRRNLRTDFGGELPKWGYCATPLLLDDLLIVNPGARDAALVALDCRTGQERWRTPGGPAAYASFIVGTFGGVRQIVGYDAESLGGWDPATGRRLWRLEPEHVDFNVPTPINAGGRLLVATENNGTRLYGFDSAGRLEPEPLAQTRELRPDTSTPVLAGGLLFGCSGRLVCLDLNDGLRTCWTAGDGTAGAPALDDYASLIAAPAGPAETRASEPGAQRRASVLTADTSVAPDPASASAGQVLILTAGGELMLIAATGRAFTPVSRLRLFDEADVWSHPALVGDRLYVRSQDEIVCLRLH